MTSLTRAEQARRNGSLSKGPATAEGKARSAGNATRHGLAAHDFLSCPTRNRRSSTSCSGRRWPSWRRATRGAGARPDGGAMPLAPHARGPPRGPHPGRHARQVRGGCVAALRRGRVRRWARSCATSPASSATSTARWHASPCSRRAVRHPISYSRRSPESQAAQRAARSAGAGAAKRTRAGSRGGGDRDPQPSAAPPPGASRRKTDGRSRAAAGQLLGDACPDCNDAVLVSR